MPCRHDALSGSCSEVLTVRITSPSNSIPWIPPFRAPNRWRSESARWGLFSRWGKTVRQILWWLPESSNLCTALHDEARFLLDSCKTALIWNASWVLSASLFRHQTWLSPVLASHPQKSLLHSPRRQCWLPCPLMGEWEWCHSTDSHFVSGSKWWTRFHQLLTIQERKVSLSALKYAHNSEEITFLLVLCLTVSLEGTHLVHNFE
jgi:hypothetical protein